MRMSMLNPQHKSKQSAIEQATAREAEGMVKILSAQLFASERQQAEQWAEQCVSTTVSH